MLDLHALAVDPPPDPDYHERPLFVHPILNRAIIAKQNVRPGEETRSRPQRIDQTKVIFPFDAADLELGGHCLFIDRKTLPHVLGDYLDYAALPVDRDLEVLGLLDALPTLDPFLLRECLAQRGIDVAPCYFQFHADDQGDMLAFVAKELSALVALCFGEVAHQDERARRMSSLLLADQNNPELLPLREALRMGPAEFADAVFAWKGFLYYRWKTRSLAPALRTARRGISQIPLRGYDDDIAQLIRGAKQAIDKAIIGICVDVRETLRVYDRAFSALTDNENPEAFRAFLHSGSKMFVDVGVRVGRLEQVVTFWAERFGPRNGTAMSPDHQLDALRDVLREIRSRPSDLVSSGRGEVVWEGQSIKAVAI